MEQVGLIGTALPADAAAVDALSRTDVPAAHAAIDQLRSVLGAAREVGTQRIVLVVGALAGALLLSGLLFFIARRRRRSRHGSVGPQVQPEGLPLQPVAGEQPVEA